jgi:predicted RNase H-like HicB family nuclease
MLASRFRDVSGTTAGMAGPLGCMVTSIACGNAREETAMITVQMVYWKDEQFWLGTWLQHPDVMSQGATIEDLEENLRDAYRLLILDDIPADAQIKTLEV